MREREGRKKSDGGKGERQEWKERGERMSKRKIENVGEKRKKEREREREREVLINDADSKMTTTAMYEQFIHQQKQKKNLSHYIKKPNK